SEWLSVVDGLWREKRFSFDGKRYTLDNAICEPKPVSKPRPTIYAGGESEAAKTMIATMCDAYVMHGDPVEAIKPKLEDMERRRAEAGKGPLQYGMAGYAIVRDSEAEARKELARITALPPTPPKGFDNFEQWLSGTELERELKLQEYSVSNRGLRPNFVGTPEQLRERIEEYEEAGLDLLLLQMSPQAEEMDRFAAQVIQPMKQAA
ncbi:MAG: dimethylsulfone monooxygenase, partial [Sphingomonadales bacterium]|nr:dimethylsulfone monooxygenase [Sphingomonadales bacterium]